MRRPAARFTLALVAATLVLASAPVTGVGTHGQVVAGTTSGVVGVLSAFTGTAAIGYLDNNPADSAVQTTEAIVLSVASSAAVQTNDILIASGNGLTGTSGTMISNPPTGTVRFPTAATLIRFVDALPTYANGGPDGVMNPGEAVFLDLDLSGTASTNDRLLASGVGLSGSPGALITSAQAESAWDNTSECIYISTDSTFQSGTDTRVDDGGFACTNGGPLQALSGVKLTGADATFTAGEEAYISSSATVVTGDYRLTTTTGGAVGTLVSCGVFGADADCGVALFGTAPSNLMVTVGTLAFGAPTFRYFDINGNALYDAADSVVIDGDANSRMSPGDLRMNTVGSPQFGTFPVLGDPEVHGYLHATVLSGTLTYLESGTNPTQIDSTEPLALHFGAGTTLGLGDICLSTVGGCTAGTQRLGAPTAPTTGGTWTAVSAATNAGTLGYSDANNNGVYDVGDSLFLHFGAVPGTVSSGDQEVGSDAGASGSRVSTAGASLKAVPFTLTYRFYDADGSGAYSPGDLVYIHRTGTGYGHAAIAGAVPGDIRLNSGTGVSGFGKNVKEGDADAVLALTNAAGAGFAYRDLDGSATFTYDDSVYLLPRATLCPQTGADVILAPGILSGATVGSFVAGTATTCTDIAAGPKFAYTPSGTFSTSSQVFLDIDGDGTIEAGDIRVTGGAGGGAGTRVNTGVDVGTTATVIDLSGTPNLAVLDASGDGTLAAQETVILDRNGDGLLTPGDVPVSGTASTSSGSTGGGGGGGTVTNPTTTTSSSPSTTSSSSTSTTASGTGTTDTIGALNLALQASLDVDRQDGQNVLTWDTQSGVTGYQVWSADSPYVLLATLSPSANTYTDVNGGKGTDYLVTAYQGTPLTEADVNAGNVPGYSGVPEGKDAGGGKKGFIPGPGIALMALALAGAVLVARRKL